ncbi:MAG: GNAT family N-acetyltransferase [Pseudomonadota bacterium]|nr:GNAT family N-acetyltransferase [Pseudomonadota bacterium]
MTTGSFDAGQMARRIADAAPRNRFEPAEAAAEVGYAIDMLCEAGAVAALAGQWRELEAKAPGATLFQSQAWCANYLEHARTGGTVELRVITARRDGRLAGLLPLAVRDDQGLKVLTGMTEPFQQYTDMLVAEGHDPKAIFRQMLPKLRTSGADYLHFGQVRRDSALFEAIDGVVPVSGEEDAAPYVPVADWPNFDSYHKTVKSKTRKNMRNARNRLERDAPVEHRRAREGALLAEVIDRSFAGREAWLERQGLTSRAFRDTGFGAFVERFKDETLSGVQAIAFSLRHGDRPMADQWGFLHKGRYYAFMAGWDESYEESSPGKLHLGAILEDCFDEGVELADFMIPAARYKFTWASDAVPVRDHVMALSLRGRVQNAIWLNFLRPLAKRAVYALPARARAALFKLVMPTDRG